MDPLRDQDNQDFNSAFKVRLSVYKHCPSLTRSAIVNEPCAPL